MTKGKITSQEIVDLISQQINIKKRISEEFLKVLFSTIEDTLMAGDTVRIKNFGVFKLHWNEPRKSVNVQTGEEIKLDGFYKVVFTPDILLKDAVNKPFAHLMAINLDEFEEDEFEISEQEDRFSEPFQLFNEQALEIKNLLIDLNSLAQNKNEVIESDKTIIEDEEQINKLNETSNEFYNTSIIETEHLSDGFDRNVEVDSQNKIILDDEDDINDEIDIIDEKDLDVDLSEEQHQHVNDIKNLEHNESQINENSATIEDISYIKNQTVVNNNQQINNPELTSKQENNDEISNDVGDNPVLSTKEISKNKSRKRSILFLIRLFFLLLIIGLSYVLYLYNEPIHKNVNRLIGLTQLNFIQQNALVKDTNYVFSKSITADSIMIKENVFSAKDSTNLETEKRFSNQITDTIFTNKRVYTELITINRMMSSNRLTTMAKKFYGNKEYWVYIFEANIETIRNPDKIAIGTLIRIPKLDIRLIDENNPKCLENAKKLQGYYKNRNYRK